MKDVQKFAKNNTYVIRKILPQQRQITPIGNYECVANFLKKRFWCMKSVHKMFERA